MRRSSYYVVGLLTLLPLCGCSSRDENKAAAGEPQPSAKELDKALERRPKVDGKNRDDGKKHEPKTWIGRAIFGVVNQGDGLSADEQSKLRDYVLDNDEYLSQHMTDPKELILRANKRPEPMRVHDKPKLPDGKSADPTKPAEKHPSLPDQPTSSVPPAGQSLEKPTATPAATGESDPFGS